MKKKIIKTEIQEIKELFNQEIKEIKKIIKQENLKKEKQIEELKGLLRAIYEHNHEQYTKFRNSHNEANRR